MVSNWGISVLFVDRKIVVKSLCTIHRLKIFRRYKYMILDVMVGQFYVYDEFEVINETRIIMTR